MLRYWKNVPHNLFNILSTERYVDDVLCSLGVPGYLVTWYKQRVNCCDNKIIYRNVENIVRSACYILVVNMRLVQLQINRIENEMQLITLVHITVHEQNKCCVENDFFYCWLGLKTKETTYLLVRIGIYVLIWLCMM